MSRPSRLLCVALALFAAACSTPSAGKVTPDAQDTQSPQDASTAAEGTAEDSVEDTRAWLRDFGVQYDYDVAYMEALLDLSPAAFEAFSAGMGMAEHRVHLPLDAHYIGVISALLADDCGQCSQLNLRIAVEAGVDRAILRQLLEDPASLPPTLLLVHDYATQVVQGVNAQPETVAGIREALGDESFAELAVNVLGARIYPALRRAMGAEMACPPLTLDF